MKIDLMMVPSDTLVLSGTRSETSLEPEGLEACVPPPAGAFAQAIASMFTAQGLAVPEPMTVSAPLLAREVAGRIEPLYPAPDDLVIDEQNKDSVFAQPAFLEPIRGDFVRHDLAGLRLLVPTSRKTSAPPLGAYLTRKGVRTWAERKAERLADGEHYILPKRLYEIEQHVEGSGAQRCVRTHVRLRPGIGFLVTVELPDGAPSPKLPATVVLGQGARTVRVEETQVPPTDLRLKAGRRWRLCVLAPMAAGSQGLPSWIDEKDWTTRAPFPQGGKLFAIASRRAQPCPQDPAIDPGARIIPTATTFFIEFNDPVRVDHTNWVLAGGY